MNSTIETTDFFNVWNTNSEGAVIDLIQSSFSLAISMCIFYKVFDFSAYFQSVKTKRAEMKKKGQQKEFERLKKLFDAMKNDRDMDDIDMEFSDGEEDESKNEPIGMVRKKKTHTRRTLFRSFFRGK